MPDTLPQSKDEGRQEDQPGAQENANYDPEEDFEEDEWDRQIKRDAEAGRLDELAERAREQVRAGNATDLYGTPKRADTAGDRASHGETQGQ